MNNENSKDINDNTSKESKIEKDKNLSNFYLSNKKEKNESEFNNSNSSKLHNSAFKVMNPQTSANSYM